MEHQLCNTTSALWHPPLPKTPIPWTWKVKWMCLCVCVCADVRWEEKERIKNKEINPNIVDTINIIPPWYHAVYCYGFINLTVYKGDKQIDMPPEPTTLKYCFNTLKKHLILWCILLLKRLYICFRISLNGAFIEGWQSSVFLLQLTNPLKGPK